MFTENTWTEGGDFQKYSLNRLLSESACDETANSEFSLKYESGRDNSPILVNPSWFSILISALRYVYRQFWLEKRNACIGCTIIMFIVCMASFIFVFFQNASSLYFYLSQESIGDQDILVQPIAHVSPQSTTRHFEAPLYKGKNKDGSQMEEEYTWQAGGKLEDQSSLNLYNLNPFSYKVEQKKKSDKKGQNGQAPD